MGPSEFGTLHTSVGSMFEAENCRVYHSEKEVVDTTSDTFGDSGDQAREAPDPGFPAHRIVERGSTLLLS